MAFIMRKKVDRDATGKESSFRVRKRPVDIQEVNRYFKRKRPTRDLGMRGERIKRPAGDVVLREASPDMTTPSCVSYWTPSPPPSAPPDTRAWQGFSLQPVDNPESVPPTLLAPSDAGQTTSLEGQHPYHSSCQPYPSYSLTVQRHSQSSDLNPRIPLPILPPRAMLLSEQLFANIRSYFSGTIRNKTWITDEHGRLLSVKKRTSITMISIASLIAVL